MRKWWRGGCALLVAAALLAPRASPLAAQADPSPEVRALRAARALEERGLLKDAELTLRAHLDVEATSSDVLFAFERVLRAQGRPVAVLPYVDNFLAVAPDSHIVRDLKLRVLAEADRIRMVVGSGDAETAGAVLAGVCGQLSALERGYLLLDRGELSGARAALLEAVAGLEPSRATEAIQLASLLGRLSGAGAAAVARAAVAAHRGQAHEAALTLERAAADLPGTERAPVLAQAARLADQVAAHADAARMRTTLVLEHPDAAEAAEVTLELARWHARTRAGVATAVRLLEELIIRTPSNALVPDARRELQRLRGIS